MLSRHLEYLPEGSEMPEETGTRFSGSQAPVLPAGAGSVEADVLLAKMRPGQSIDLEAHCIKGARPRPHRGRGGGAPAAAGPSTEVLQADMRASTPKLVVSAVLNRCERRKEWTRPCAEVKGFQWRNPPRTWRLPAWGARRHTRCHKFDGCLLHSGSTSLKCEVSHWGFRF